MSIGSTPITAAPLTMACWFRPVAVTTDMILMSIAKGSAQTDRFQLTARGSVSPKTISCDAIQASAGGRSSTVNASSWVTGVWLHAAAVFISSSSKAVYLNGADKGTGTSHVPASLDSIGIGAAPETPTSGFSDGRIAECGLWNIALTDDEILSLARGLPPWRVRPGNLVGYWPLWGLQSPEVDLTSGARSLTFTGSPTLADGPPVIPFSRQFWNASLDVTSTNGSAAGSIGTITLTAPTGVATGDAGATGSIGTVTIASPTGVATGGAGATGSTGTVTLTAPTAAATGGAGGTGALGTVTLSAPTGVAIGAAGAAGSIGTITLTAPTGSAQNGNANATGAIATLTWTAPTGTASGGGAVTHSSLVSRSLARGLSYISTARGESLSYRTSTSGSFTTLTGWVLDRSDNAGPQYDESNMERTVYQATLSGPLTPTLSVGYQVQDGDGRVWSIKGDRPDGQQQIFFLTDEPLANAGPDRGRTR